MKSGEQMIWEARMAQLPRLAGLLGAANRVGLARALLRAVRDAYGLAPGESLLKAIEREVHYGRD